jgi:hypothetical protein
MDLTSEGKKAHPVSEQTSDGLDSYLKSYAIAASPMGDDVENMRILWCFLSKYGDLSTWRGNMTVDTLLFLHDFLPHRMPNCNVVSSLQEAAGPSLCQSQKFNGSAAVCGRPV